jgi:hypothetical protein
MNTPKETPVDPYEPLDDLATAIGLVSTAYKALDKTGKSGDETSTLRIAIDLLWEAHRGLNVFIDANAPVERSIPEIGEQKEDNEDDG